MLKWIREYVDYSRHEKWLQKHFEGNYITARDGSAVLTAIVDKLHGADPNGSEFEGLARAAIASFTRPSTVYGEEAVTYWEFLSPPRQFKVPARFITIEA